MIFHTIFHQYSKYHSSRLFPLDFIKLFVFSIVKSIHVSPIWNRCFLHSLALVHNLLWRHLVDLLGVATEWVPMPAIGTCYQISQFALHHSFILSFRPVWQCRTSIVFTSVALPSKNRKDHMKDKLFDYYICYFWEFWFSLVCSF